MEITTQPITTMQYNVTLDDADVTAILINPLPFQEKLRALRGAQHTGKHGARDTVRIFNKKKTSAGG